MAVQDPSYPANGDSSVIMGQTGLFQKDVEKYSNIEYMSCGPENGFFPDLSAISWPDIIFFCSANNPTGSAATKEQLTHLVQSAKDNGSIIVYDSAYAMYISGVIQDPSMKFLGPRRLCDDVSFLQYLSKHIQRIPAWKMNPRTAHPSLHTR